MKLTVKLIISVAVAVVATALTTWYLGEGQTAPILFIAFCAATLATALLVSIPLVVAGSKLILRLIERFPVVIVLGGALLGWIAGELIATDPAAAELMKGLPPWTHRAFSVLGAVLVVAVAKALVKRREARAVPG